MSAILKKSDLAPTARVKFPRHEVKPVQALDIPVVPLNIAPMMPSEDKSIRFPKKTLKLAFQETDPILRYKRYTHALILAGMLIPRELAEESKISPYTFTAYFREYAGRYNNLPSIETNCIIENRLKQVFRPEYHKQISLINELLLDAHKHLAGMRESEFQTAQNRFQAAVENLLTAIEKAYKQKGISSAKYIEEEMGSARFFSTHRLRKSLPNAANFEKVLSVIFGSPGTKLSEDDRNQMQDLYQLYSIAFKEKYANENIDHRRNWTKKTGHLNGLEILALHFMESILPNETKQFQTALAAQKTAGAQRTT